ncbi:MAG: tRNA (N6-isopentenyl adenosine(37)-C2)-methylthiotransferase MiaB [Synergistaceae bacterium]
MKNFAVRIFGCQMNSYDGDRIKTALIHKGWTEVSDDTADVVILVTCSIREKAEQKVASEIGRYQVRYRKNEEPMVVLVGCMAQRIGMEMSKKFPCVKLVSGPRHLGLLPDAIELLRHDNAPIFFMDNDPRELIDLNVPPTSRENPFKAYVTITYGCDRFCTYCIVPYVRGRLQSRSHEDILAEISVLTKDNTLSEITLLGQNVDAYGKDRKDNYSFANLLDDVCKIDNLKRLRFATSHPKDFDEDILEVMSSRKQICRAINLPVQSGSDRILQEMNRGYTAEQYMSLVRKIRSALPNVSLTTDLIVGFPGETEQDFMDSYNLLKEIEFDIVHTAAYSPREGTKAAVMQNQIPDEIKFERLNRMNDMQSSLARNLNEEYEGRIEEILVDGPAPKGGGLLQGRTVSDKVVIIKGSNDLIGKFLKVKIKRGSHWSLLGEIV